MYTPEPAPFANGKEPHPERRNGRHQSSQPAPQNDELIDDVVTIPLNVPEGLKAKARVPLNELVRAIAVADKLTPAELRELVVFLASLPVWIEISEDAEANNEKIGPVDPRCQDTVLHVFEVMHRQEVLKTSTAVTAALVYLHPTKQAQQEEQATENNQKATQAPQKQLEMALIKLSWKLIRDRQWKRTQAAVYAGRMLGRTINPDVWQQRVDYWQEKWGLPKIELKRRRAS